MFAASVVGFLLIKLKSILNEEAKLLQGVRNEMRKLVLELEHIRAFLEDAEANQGGDQRFQTWVKQVMDVSYEIEDLLDEFLVHLWHPHGDGFVGFLQTCVRSFKNLSARHRIANQIQELQILVRDIAELRTRYDHNRVEHRSGSSHMAYDPRLAALFVNEAELVDIDWRKEKLVEWFLQDNSKLITISLVGMAGVGKTTLAKLVYEKVKASFQYCAWINASMASKTEKLLRSMIKEFFKARKDQVPEGIDKMENSDLISILRAYLLQAKYVIVLDDIWDDDVLRGVKLALPETECGSRIMFTTRNRRIARSHCSTSDNRCKYPHKFVFYNEPLSSRDAWILFCKKAFQSEPGGSCPPELKQLSEKILKRCDGLPLAIAAVGGLLSRKEMTLVEWERVHRSLGSEMEEDNSELQRVKSMLFLSYDDLPYHLKACFLYFSIFPENCFIGLLRIIRLWIAEGFVQKKEGKTPEEVADDYLSEIIARSLIQVAEYYDHAEVRSFRLHDFMREIILSKSREERFSTFSTRESARLTSFNRVRRLSVQNDFQGLPRNDGFSHLRSLFTFGIGNSTAGDVIPSRIGSLSSFRLLKVLDMEGAPIGRFPSEIGALFHLRYLSMKGTKISSVSKCLGKLQNLQTLNLKETQVSELPIEINKLEQLGDLLVYRYVDLPFHYVLGFMLFDRIGKLRSLRTLAFLELNQGASIIKELTTLTQLRRLAVTKLKREDGRELCASIQKMTNMDSLSVQSADEDEFLDLSSLQSPPPLLQRLYLKGRLEKLPDWIPSLQNLVKITLRFSRLHPDYDPLAELKSLPYLLVLELSEAYEGRDLSFEYRAFPRLQTLRLYHLHRLSLIVFNQGSLPNLRRLFIVDCIELRMVPTGIEHLHQLQELHLVGLPDLFFTKRLKMLDWESESELLICVSVYNRKNSIKSKNFY